MQFRMLRWLMVEIHVHGMEKSRERNPASPYGCVSACHPSSCLPQQGQASSLFRVIPRPMAVISHSFPAQTPCFPRNSLLMCCSHPPCLILPASNCWCFGAGKVSHCLLLSMGCGKLLVLNKLQLLPKIIAVVGQELGALLTQGIVFACVKKGWGLKLPCLLSATGQWQHGTGQQSPSCIFQGKACHSPSPHHPPTKVKERHTSIRYGADIRQGITLPCNHTREGHEVSFKGQKGKEMSLGWDHLEMRSWCCGSRKNVNHLHLQAVLGGSTGFGCQLFHLAEPLAEDNPH